MLLYKKKVFYKKNTFFFVLLILGLLFFISHTTQTHNWFKLNRKGISILTLVYIINCIISFHNILREQKVIFLEKLSFFWVNTALLLYSSGAFFLFLIYDDLNNKEQKMLWGTVFLSLNILKNILLGIALSKKEER
jgi:hypothetical protein